MTRPLPDPPIEPSSESPAKLKADQHRRDMRNLLSSSNIIESEFDGLHQRAALVQRNLASRLKALTAEREVLLGTMFQRPRVAGVDVVMVTVASHTKKLLGDNLSYHIVRRLWTLREPQFGDGDVVREEVGHFLTANLFVQLDRAMVNRVEVVKREARREENGLTIKQAIAFRALEERVVEMWNAEWRAACFGHESERRQRF
ncbi:hypothetical protein LTS18_007357 [Coniosporium uncinatum]|uniref:Uncharacterized protein n=1 Tax=Coniosporium uncinatum TaxID=93489 RepID=A0ACC3D2T3_9PEZI|nr:hypothetical protein LTS18_007357 [Coniosporium uncinatum]